MNKELLKALQAVQKELEPIKKNSKGFNYKYADLPRVWEKIGKLLEKNGFLIVHEVNPDGVKTTAYHEHGSLSSTIPFSNEQMKPQEIGSEITYFKRYNLTSLFNVIIEGEDDDGQTAQDKKVVMPKNLPATGELKCLDCGGEMKVSRNTNKPYCPNRYNGACPPKPKTESDQKIEEEVNAWPEPAWANDPIPTIQVEVESDFKDKTITIDDIK